MTKRDFFRIIIKLFGLYVTVIAIFSIIPSYVGLLAAQFDVSSMLMVLVLIAIVIAFIALLIFGSDKIINFLKLDKGFDEDRIELGSLKGINILKLAIIVIGGILIIDNFPIFLSQSYYALKAQVSNRESMLDAFSYMQADYFQLSVSIISIVVGYLMITNYTSISRWLLNTNKKNLS